MRKSNILFFSFLLYSKYICNRYYLALKTLEQLQHNYLPLIADFRFAQTMQTLIPKIRDDIRDRSLNELPDFLMSVRSHSNFIGQETMRRVARINNMDETVVCSEPEPETPYSSPADVIDYSSVYRCFHICAVLGYRDFGVKYHIQRTFQCKQTCNKQEVLANMSAFKKFYCEVVGFFVCESYLASKFPELVTEEHVKRLWATEARQRVEHTIKKGLEHSTKATDILEIKLATIIFAKSLTTLGLSCNSFFNCLFELRDSYNQLLLVDYSKEFDQMIANDTYTPLEVKNLDEYNEVLSKFPYHSDTTDNEFPRKFPFSYMIVDLYSHLCNYMKACKAYIDDLGKSAINVEDTVCNYVNAYTSHIIKRTFERMLDEKRTLTLPQIVQILINLSCLEESCYHLEQFVSSLVSSSNQGKEEQISPKQNLSRRRSSLQNIRASVTAGGERQRFRARLVAQTTFRDIRSHAEKKLHVILKSKVDEFFSLAEYDWQLKSSSGKPSQFILEMFSFLNVTIHNIPLQVTPTVLMQTCGHIGLKMWELLFDPDVKQISDGAIEQFNLDVIQAEMFALANSSNAFGLNEGALSKPFTKLRQMLELVSGQDYNAYLKSLTQNGYSNSPNFNELHANDVMMIVDKLRDKKFFSVTKKTEREKLLEYVASQLQHMKSNNNYGLNQ